MKSIEWKVALIHLDIVIHYETFPLEILAKPYSESLLLHHSLKILE